MQEPTDEIRKAEALRQIVLLEMFEKNTIVVSTKPTPVSYSDPRVRSAHKLSDDIAEAIRHHMHHEHPSPAREYWANKLSGVGMWDHSKDQPAIDVDCAFVAALTVLEGLFTHTPTGKTMQLLSILRQYTGVVSGKYAVAAAMFPEKTLAEVAQWMVEQEAATQPKQ